MSSAKVSAILFRERRIKHARLSDNAVPCVAYFAKCQAVCINSYSEMTFVIQVKIVRENCDWPPTEMEMSSLWRSFITGMTISSEATKIASTWWRHQMETLFRVIGPLWGESTGHRWIPLIKASVAELWCFLWPAHEQTVEQTIETPVSWNAIALIMTSL